MRVLITGAGLVGCHSAREIALRGHAVWLYDLNPNRKYIDAIAGKKGIEVLQGDLLDLPAMVRALMEARPTVVVGAFYFALLGLCVLGVGGANRLSFALDDPKAGARQVDDVVFCASAY